MQSISAGAGRQAGTAVRRGALLVQLIIMRAADFVCLRTCATSCLLRHCFLASAQLI